jgi:orotate phosphoribosyltransferase
MGYREEFLEFMVRSGVLTFGDFVTKSGRNTPYFINTGNYRSGSQIAKLGQFYAELIMDKIGNNFDILYGPAYKGIPLSVSSSIALFEKYGIDKGFCFNRKENKDHGEGGILIGTRPMDSDRIVIIEDVITAGVSVRESITLLKSVSNIVLKAIIVSVDRMEKGVGNNSALQEIQEQFHVDVFPLLNLQEIVDYLYNRPIDGRIILTEEIKNKIIDYSVKYGITRIL